MRLSRSGRCAKTLAYLAALPSTVAGSGTPQCAVIGWPGHTGQISPAALSQTVNTKSSGAAPGCANSSQLLLRRPSIGIRFARRNSSAKGLTLPVGCDPALCATNRPAPTCLRIDSAMTLRAELPVQEKDVQRGVFGGHGLSGQFSRSARFATSRIGDPDGPDDGRPSGIASCRSSASGWHARHLGNRSRFRHATGSQTALARQQLSVR